MERLRDEMLALIRTDRGTVPVPAPASPDAGEAP
jgi:hypothetical protein